MSGGGQKDPKLITNVNWSSRFWDWVMLGSVRLVVKFVGNCKIVIENYKTSPKSANVSLESTNFVEICCDLVRSG